MKSRQWKSIVYAGAVMLSLAGCSAPAGETAQETGDSILVFENGMAQPMLVYSDINTPNPESEILRFCVYVETDHDTDSDGKADLVKAFIQLPKSAAEGKYKAAAIYDPMPYTAGIVSYMQALLEADYGEESFDKSRLYEPGTKRESSGKTDTMTTTMEADSSQWLYTVPGSNSPGYYTAALYDYYLIRGFAIVECGGIGTYGSEEFELCGTDLERDCHKNVVEWLAGNRRAFTDRENNI